MYLKYLALRRKLLDKRFKYPGFNHGKFIIMEAMSILRNFLTNLNILLKKNSSNLSKTQGKAQCAQNRKFSKKSLI